MTATRSEPTEMKLFTYLVSAQRHAMFQRTAGHGTIVRSATKQERRDHAGMQWVVEVVKAR